jgi:hypothetical protein
MTEKKISFTVKTMKADVYKLTLPPTTTLQQLLEKIAH